MAAAAQEQLSLVRETARRARPLAPEGLAEVDPVASVVLDLPLAHLDRPFDYAVPASLAATAVPGVRVRVRLAGQDVDGFVTERRPTSRHPGRLAPLRRVVSAEPVLDPEVLTLARAVADRYAGTLADVLRLTVPPRHARVERAGRGASEIDEAGRAAARAVRHPPDPAEWAPYPAGRGLLRSLATGGCPRVVVSALPGTSWPSLLAAAVQATLASGRGALVVVPDARDVRRLDGALTAALGEGHHVALTADLGPAERYRRWLAARRGDVRAVIGTRAAAFAPIAALGLVAIWDDGDDSHAEPRAPYPHAREVLTLRAHLAGSGCLLAGFSRSAEAALLVRSGWASEVAAGRATVRRAAPRVHALGEDTELARDPAAATARLPTAAWEAARAALARGPVLVQVPRRGYLPSLGCQGCRAPARCSACSGPLTLAAGGQPPDCRWCGRRAAGWRCPGCGSAALRARTVGTGRTAEELGRAFPGVPVRVSGRADGLDVPGVLDRVGPEPALVVATPGSEPVAEGGYAAALLLDGSLLLGRADLRAGEEALRRWMEVSALVRPASAGGTVVVVAPPGAAAVQALVRWDPAGHADRELADREALRLPPAARVATVTGPSEAVRALLAAAPLGSRVEVLGPLPLEPKTSPDPEDPAEQVRHRAVLRASRTDAAELSAALTAAQAARSARKAAAVRVRIDPPDL